MNVLAQDVVGVVWAVPVALVAARFGVRGGLTLAVAAVVLSTTWLVLGVGEPGVLFALEAVVLLCLGLIVGRFADRGRAHAEQLRRHEDLSLDLICTANFDGYFTCVNPAWTRTLGYSREELLARPFLDFVHPDDREATVAEAERQTKAGEEVLRFENRYRHQDGSYRWLEWTSHPDEQAQELIAVARDVTVRKQAEETVRRYQEMLEWAVKERTRELEEARLEVLQRLALAAEYRDDETYEHTERVARTAAAIAETLGLAAHEVALIRQAAPLHDLGKIAVSDRILLKPGRLTHEELETMRTHTSVGATMLSGSSSDVLRLAGVIALTHHEWWDGNGYPAKLKGEEIPQCGRIVALADVFDALTHTRPYKEAWPVEKAVEEIRRLRQRQFDPAVVDAFTQLDARKLAYPHHTRTRRFEAAA